MKAGFAKCRLTPPLGMEMEGLGQQGGCTGVHDDLFVRALFLSHEGREALILGFDLLFFEREVVDRFKGAIGRRIDLAPSQILLNTSHNHAGPRLTRWSYGGAPEPAYLDQIERAVMQATCRARSDARDVTIWAAATRTDTPVSRRKPGPDGKAQWAPHHEGTVCDVLPFSIFKDAGGRVVSLLFSVSCHPSIYHGTEITAEYPAAATRRLNAHFATEGSLFLQGAGGDAKPLSIADEPDRWRHGDFEAIEATGAEIADKIIDRSKRPLTRIEPDLRTWMTDLDWPLEPPPDRSYFDQVLKGGPPTDPNEPLRTRRPPDQAKSPQRRAWAQDMLATLDRTGKLPQAVEVSLHAMQLGRGLRLIGLEGEAVAGLGLVILDAFDNGVTFPLGYTNGAQIYLPTSDMLAEEGYEVTSYWEYHYPAPIAPGGEEVLQGALRRMQQSGWIPND